MAVRFRLLLIFCLFVVFAFVSCQKEPRQKRPVPGDMVTPVILLGKTWKQNGPVLISGRLQVQGKDESEPALLQLEEVPYERTPRVDLTFFAGAKELQRLDDVHLTRDC